jgi:hypothetical protein
MKARNQIRAGNQTTVSLPTYNCRRAYREIEYKDTQSTSYLIPPPLTSESLFRAKADLSEMRGFTPAL